MALQDSGEIKFSDIATEYGVSLSNVSLGTLSENIGLTPDHAITEFYGKSADITIGDLTNTITTDVYGNSLSLSPVDAVYFGGYHFISSTSTSGSYYSDDDGVTWTPSGSVFDQNAKFTVAGNILIATSRNYLAFYRFGSEPNSYANTTYFSDLDLYRTKYDLNINASRTPPIVYDGFVYKIQNNGITKYNLTDYSGYNVAATYWSHINLPPAAIGNDGRVITFGINGTQPSFIVSDNFFVNYSIIPLPSVADYPYTTASSSISWFNDSDIATNGNGTWIFTPRLFHTFTGGQQYSLYAYSTDNGDSWTATQDYYDIIGAMNYTPGVTNTVDGNFGNLEVAKFENNKFYYGYGYGSGYGGIMYSSDGTNITSLKNIGVDTKVLSFNGSTLVAAGTNKILRFT